MELILHEKQTAPLNPFPVIIRQLRFMQEQTTAKDHKDPQYSTDVCKLSVMKSLNTESWKKEICANRNPLPLETVWKTKHNKPNHFFWFFFPQELLQFSPRFWFAFLFSFAFQKMKNFNVFIFFSIKDSWRSYKNKIVSPVLFWTFSYSHQWKEQESHMNSSPSQKPAKDFPLSLVLLPLPHSFCFPFNGCWLGVQRQHTWIAVPLWKHSLKWV